MKKRKLGLFLILAALGLSSCGETIFDFSIDSDVIVDEGTKIDDSIDPFGGMGLYTDPEIEIDGIRESCYDYPTGSGKINVFTSDTETTDLYLYKGDKAIYFYFDCQDDSISCLNVENINIVTAQSDSCELYVDTYGAGGKKRTATDYEFRMTASGRVYSYLNGFVSKVFLNEGSTINFHKDVDNGWVIEGYIAYKSLGSDVNKLTPTSFQYARVTKTANRNYKWNGFVDPQIPDNYKVLHTDNKMYNLRDVPLTKTITGKLIDTAGNPLKSIKVTAAGLKTIYTKEDGSYTLECQNITSDVTLKFSKKDYLDYSKVITHEELRNNHSDIYDAGTNVFLSSVESTYHSTIKGKLTERDGVTPIAGATITLNSSNGTTDSNGCYEFDGLFDGYNNSVEFAAPNHTKYVKNVEYASISINGVTEFGNNQLDEDAGGVLGFGKYITGFAEARILRQETTFKVVMKIEADMSQEGCSFEMFVDTKDSGIFNHRDGTDYLFVFEYADGSIPDITNYGGKTVRGDSIVMSRGRINEQYFIEADIPYTLLELTNDEVFGLYFGAKVEYSWEGMYENGIGSYIKAEGPINYFRVAADSSIFQASCNTEPLTTENFTKLGTIGDDEENHSLLQYDVSMSRNSNSLMLKLEKVDNGANYTDYATAIHARIDMNASTTKENRDTDCTHIEVYPPRPVSHYMKYDPVTGDDSKTMIYEENCETKYAYYFKDTIYLIFSTDVFGGQPSNNIGFSLGIWNGGNGKTSFLKPTNAIGNPSTYTIVSPSGDIL